LVLSILGASINLYVFKAGGQQKTLNEADELQLKASANRVLQEVNNNPASHPQLVKELNRLYKSLIYRPPFDSPLSVYERAAFGLLVENYAGPMSEVQLRNLQAREKLFTDLTSVNGRPLGWQELSCMTDPFGYGCKGEKGIGEDDTPEAGKK
jgi:hypothetical protein